MPKLKMLCEMFISLRQKKVLAISRNRLCEFVKM